MSEKEKKEIQEIKSLAELDPDSAYINPEVVSKDGEKTGWLIIGNRAHLGAIMEAWINLQEKNLGIPVEELDFAKRLHVFLTGTPKK